MQPTQMLTTTPTLPALSGNPAPRAINAWRFGSLNWLLVIALGVDILTPLPIFLGLLPASLRWISHAALATAIGLLLLRMLLFRHIPRTVGIITAVSIIWVPVALLRGQGLLPTLWGWWIMFQYPLVSLFAYLEPAWPARFPRLLWRVILAMMLVQVVAQTGQYLSGQAPGDNLAGLFGFKGTGNLLIFLAFAFSMALGLFLSERKLLPVVITLALGSVSSAMGEMKFFLVALAGLAGLAFLVYALSTRQFLRLLPYVLLVGLFLAGFVNAYNSVVPEAYQMPLQEFIRDPSALGKYLNFNVQRVDNVTGETYSDFGRNYALRYGFDTIRKDSWTLLFGMGLGARGESRTLNTAGEGLTSGQLGMISGTTLLVMMQELGLVGLIGMALFILGLAAWLVKDIRAWPASPARALRFALLLFTLLWPLWFWYNTVWVLRVPMLLYWMSLGYVFAEARASGSSRSPVRSPNASTY